MFPSFLLYLGILLSLTPCRCRGGRASDMLRCAGWSPGRCRRHIRWRLVRHRRRSQGGRADTLLALGPRRSPQDSPPHTRRHGGSETPHTLHQVQFKLLYDSKLKTNIITLFFLCHKWIKIYYFLLTKTCFKSWRVIIRLDTWIMCKYFISICINQLSFED